MDPTTVQTLAEACGGIVRQGDPSVLVSTISKDTRTLGRGDVYWALSGENFDGHNFLEAAKNAGASVVVVSREVTELPESVVVVRVEDTLKALHQLAAWYRARLRARVIVLTGSNGKTSTKDFTAGVVSRCFRVNKTAGNLNNHIGLPLTILSASAEDEVAVWEIGMNHVGEIEELSRLARPDIGIITNVGMAHIEFLGTREAIAQEKGMLAEALTEEGRLILLEREAFVKELTARTQARVVLVGGEDKLHVENVQTTSRGLDFDLVRGEERAATSISVLGEHMIGNALLAVAAGLELGMGLGECAEGLALTQLSKGRLACLEIRGVRVLDDTYNANPDSMEAALRTLSNTGGEGRKIAVLGRMGELGEHANEGYRRVGRLAAELVDIFIVVGKEAIAMAEEAIACGAREVHSVETAAEAINLLKAQTHSGDVVVVKGSRSARMEQVIEGFA